MKKQRQELAAAGAQAAYDAFKMREASRELDHVSDVLLVLSSLMHGQNWEKAVVAS